MMHPLSAANNEDGVPVVPLEDVWTRSPHAPEHETDRSEPPAPPPYAEGIGWQEVEVIREGNNLIRWPNIVVGPDGRVHIIWTEDGWLWYTHRQADGWALPKRLFMGIQPHVMMDEEGVLHMAFVHEFGRRWQVYYTRYSEPMWSLPYEISRTPGISQNPSLWVAPEGHIHVVWEDDSTGYAGIYHAHNPEGIWINAPVPGVRGRRPALAGDAEGTVHLVWESPLAQERWDDIYHAQWTEAGWSLPENISDSPGRASAQAAVATDKEGTVHIVWREVHERTGVIAYSYGRYASWRKPVALSVAEAAENPRVVVGPDESVHVIWRDSQSGGWVVHRYRRGSEDAVWHTAQVAYLAPRLISQVSAASGPDGSLHVVWVEENKHNQVLAYRMREPVKQRKQYIPVAMG